MAWSTNPSSYPAQIREVFEALMATGHETTHTFETLREARAFERQVHGYRFALSKSKTNPDGALMAPQYTAELSDDGLTVRLCSVNNTRRAQLASRVARQQREQFKAAGVKFTFYAPLADETKE